LTTSRFARPGPGSRVSDLVEDAITRTGEGDTHALHFLYVRFADEVSTFVGSIVRNAQEVDHVTQTVFARLAGEARQYDPEQLPFTAWILRLAERVARDHTGENAQPKVDEVGRNGARGGTGARRSPHHGEALRLREALHRLPHEQRQVLVLRHVAGWSVQDIAERLGLTEASVRGLDEDGRRTLRATNLGAAGITLGKA
jgi:RNA polymerase sigma-70 factor, ECF subfamily